MFEELEYWTQASRLKFEPAMSDIQLERVPTNLFRLNSQHKGEPQIWLPDKHKKNIKHQETLKDEEKQISSLD